MKYKALVAQRLIDRRVGGSSLLLKHMTMVFHMVAWFYHGIKKLKDKKGNCDSVSVLGNKVKIAKKKKKLPFRKNPPSLVTVKPCCSHATHHVLTQRKIHHRAESKLTTCRQKFRKSNNIYSFVAL